MDVRPLWTGTSLNLPGREYCAISTLRAPANLRWDWLRLYASQKIRVRTGPFSRRVKFPLIGERRDGRPAEELQILARTGSATCERREPDAIFKLDSDAIREFVDVGDARWARVLHLKSDAAISRGIYRSRHMYGLH